jgi:K+-transporting ATPase ATPase C chain
MLSQLRPALVATVFFTLLLGVAYPLTVTGIAMLMPSQAEGSLVTRGGKTIGSTLIAQPFTQAKYLHPRPSAAGMNGYDASGSAGSNYGPLSEDLAKRETRTATDLRADGAGVIPTDAVTTSASGLDPDISPANAARQAARIAAARGLPAGRVQAIIERNTRQPVLGFLGQPVVNVLKTNLALDAAQPRAQTSNP